MDHFISIRTIELNMSMEAAQWLSDTFEDLSDRFSHDDNRFLEDITILLRVQMDSPYTVIQPDRLTLTLYDKMADWLMGLMQNDLFDDEEDHETKMRCELFNVLKKLLYSGDGMVLPSSTTGEDVPF